MTENSGPSAPPRTAPLCVCVCRIRSRLTPDQTTRHNRSLYCLKCISFNKEGACTKAVVSGQVQVLRLICKSYGIISIITLGQTRVSPLSLFHPWLQIQPHVNRLHSIRHELYFHNRVGVRNIFKAALSKQHGVWREEDPAGQERKQLTSVVTSQTGAENVCCAGTSSFAQVRLC